MNNISDATAQSRFIANRCTNCGQIKNTLPLYSIDCLFEAINDADFQWKVQKQYRKKKNYWKYTNYYWNAIVCLVGWLVRLNRTGCLCFATYRFAWIFTLDSFDHKATTNWCVCFFFLHIKFKLHCSSNPQLIYLLCFLS